VKNQKGYAGIHNEDVQRAKAAC